MRERLRSEGRGLADAASLVKVALARRGGAIPGTDRLRIVNIYRARPGGCRSPRPGSASIWHCHPRRWRSRRTMRGYGPRP